MYKKEDFITDFTQFEQWCKDHDYNDVNGLENCLKPYSKIRDDFYFFRKIRNFFIHNKSTEKRIKLTDTFKSDFRNLSSKFMADLKDIAIPESKIYKQKMIDQIFPAISVMKEKVYTHIPIMMGNKVWGVFSESTLFDLAGKGHLSKINESTCFVDLGTIIHYRKNGVYDFIDSRTSLEDVMGIFAEAVSKKRKLEVLFITTTGNKDGDLLGMITVWDIAGI